MQIRISQVAPSADAIDPVVALSDLVQSAQAGCHSAFDTLQRTYSRRLFKQIIAITKHHEDAEDALQDTLCKAYVAFPLFERRCHVYTWLSRIAINYALMKVRKRKTLHEFSLDGQDSNDERELVLELPDHGRSPEDIYSGEEGLRQIATVVQSLDPQSRHILLLRANHDYSMGEIAGVLNVSVSAAKARLYRARHVLRLYLPDPHRRAAVS